MNKKIILLISMFMMMLVLGSNVFALDSTQVPDIYISEVTITTSDNYGECLINIRLRNPLITIQQVHPWRARTVELCAHFVAADSDISVRSVFDNLNTYVENNKYNSSTRATIVNSGINKIYLAKSCAVSSNRYQLVIRDSSLCSKDNLLDVYVFQEFVDPNLWHTNMDLMDNIFYLNSSNELKSIDLEKKDSSNFFYKNKPEFHYDYFNIDARFSKPITDQTPVVEDSDPVQGNTGGTTAAASGGTTATGTYTKSHLQACKDLGYVEHPSYPVGLADGVPVGNGRTKAAEPGDYLYKCEESSVFGNSIRVTRCNPYTGDFGLGAGEPRGEIAISELHEQLCQEIEQIRRAEEEQREAELYDTININYHIKQLDKVIEAKEDPIELSYNPEKTIFYLNYNRPAVVLNNLDLNFVLPQDFNSDKNTCYLITSLGQNTQADINTFFDKFIQENNYIEDSNALSNVNCNQITENNVILRAARMEEKYFLALQKIDDTNILVTSAQIKFMNRELYLSYLRYEINKKIARFFCPNCNLPSIETPTESTQTFSYPQKTLRVLKEEVPVVADVDETAQTGNLITSFVINEVSGVINNSQNAIKVTLPEGTDVTNLTPTITVSEGATVNPASGVAQNFTDPVNYTVTPETGDQKVYTVVVNHSISEGGGAGDITLEKAANGCYTSNTASIAILRGEDIGKTKTYFTQRRTASSIPYNSDPNNTNTNPSLTIAQINTILSNRTNYEPPSELQGMGAIFYNLGVLYDIDPIYALAFFSQEYSMYNQVVGTFKKNNSGYNGYVSRANIAGISNGTGCLCGQRNTDGSYCKYNSIAEGIEGFYRYLKEQNSGSLYRNKTVTQVAGIWNTVNPNYGTELTSKINTLYSIVGK